MDYTRLLIRQPVHLQVALVTEGDESNYDERNTAPRVLLLEDKELSLSGTDENVLQQISVAGAMC